MPLATISTRSNRFLFIRDDSGSPCKDQLRHISMLSPLDRLVFQEQVPAGEVIFRIEGDVTPTSQQDEEAPFPYRMKTHSKSFSK